MVRQFRQAIIETALGKLKADGGPEWMTEYWSAVAACALWLSYARFDGGWFSWPLSVEP